MNKLKFNSSFFNRKNKIIIKKDNNYDTAVIKFSDKLIITKNENDREIMRDKIKNFLKVMNEECESFDNTKLLKNFKKTLFDLSLVENRSDFNGNVSFNYLDKNITFTIDNFDTVYHELMHLSTIDKNNDLTGFKQSYWRNFRGRGLNEGYTQLLTERYFNENIGLSYNILVFFLNILENIIGKNNMEKYYFNVSLNLLINELEKYEEKENILNFIDDFDLLLNHDITTTENPQKEQVIYFQNIVDGICDFLLSCLQKKIENLLYCELDSNKIKELNNLCSINLPEQIKIFYTSMVIPIKLFNKDKINEINNLINNDSFTKLKKI